MAINYTNTLLVILLIAVIILSYRMFTVSVDTSDYERLISKLKTEKAEIIKAIEDKDKSIAEIYRLIQQKDLEINKKEKEIAKLKKIMNEKADSIYSLDNKHTYELLSSWLSEDNQ